MITTVSVTATIHRQDGLPDVGAVVTARLTAYETCNGSVVPRTQTARADSDGVAVLQLWPNELGSQGSRYKITIQGTDGTVKKLYATVPNADCNLWEIVGLDAYPQSYWSNKVDRDVDAVAGNVPVFDAQGNTVDSGYAPGDLGGGGGVSDHGLLTGLDGDDHPQYHTDARGDARYSPLGHDHDADYDAAGSGAAAVAGHESAYDHSGLHSHTNKTTLDAVTAAFTSEEKTKLSGIAESANNYTHPAAHSPSIITQDSSNRFVTDTEKSTWNAKVGVITSNLTLYVATTGSDATGDGSSGSPWYSLAPALTYLSHYRIQAGVSVTISIAAGNYTWSSIPDFFHSDSRNIAIVGAGAGDGTGSTTNINTTQTYAFRLYSFFQFKKVRVTSTGTTNICFFVERGQLILGSSSAGDYCEVYGFGYGVRTRAQGCAWVYGGSYVGCDGAAVYADQNTQIALYGNTSTISIDGESTGKGCMAYRHSSVIKTGTIAYSDCTTDEDAQTSSYSYIGA